MPKCGYLVLSQTLTESKYGAFAMINSSLNFQATNILSNRNATTCQEIHLKNDPYVFGHGPGQPARGDPA